MKSLNFEQKKTQIRKAVEARLICEFSKIPKTEVSEAAKYAVLEGGHRWRPIIAVAAGEIFTRNDALKIVLPGACGAELAHAASLILDDLPSMDNAEYRRGKACTHLVFPSWSCDMAPVFLITLAYHISLNNPNASHERRIAAALELSNAGLQMINGQVKDIQQDNDANEWQQIEDLYALKSGALYAASGKAGALLCGADEEEAITIYHACMNLGLSYQIMDDIADIVADLPEVGKKSGMDENKLTSVDIFGLKGARSKSVEYQQKGLTLLESFGTEADWLRTLICEASWKNN